MRLLAVWIINAAALFLVGYLISGVHLGSFGSAMIAALVLGLVNALIRPILVILTLPVTLLTLGLFIFVINALLFLFVGNLLQGFVVDGFGRGAARLDLVQRDCVDPGQRAAGRAQLTR
jgi:putative membrane protein